MKDILIAFGAISALFLVALRVIGFDNFDPLLLIPLVGFGIMIVTGHYGIGDPSVPKCECGHHLIEIRNGAKTRYYYPGADSWNIQCPKCGRKHFIYTKPSEWIG